MVASITHIWRESCLGPRANVCVCVCVRKGKESVRMDVGMYVQTCI